jgi:hypothetical protein
MSQIPAEYTESLNRPMPLLNRIVVKQLAIEAILKDRGVTNEQWNAAFAEAVQSVGWAVMPERGIDSLRNALLESIC